MSSSSEPISSARSTTARLELPRSNCNPRVKYAVVANITTKPTTRSAIRKDGSIVDAWNLTKNGNYLSHFYTTNRLTKR